MTIIKAFSLSLALLATTACTTGSRTSTPSDNVETKTAGPSGNKSRLLDCIGKNQTTKGNTRSDCLPNDADGAERDTEQGAGGVEIWP